MKLNRTDAFWDRSTRNSINENWDILEGSARKMESDFNNFKDSVTEDVVDQLVDNARLDWKEPVESYADLPADDPVGTVRQVLEPTAEGVNKMYRKYEDGWKVIQEYDATAINEVDSRLTAQLAENMRKSINGEKIVSLSSYSRIAPETDDIGRIKRAVDEAENDSILIISGDLELNSTAVFSEKIKGFSYFGGEIRATSDGLECLLEINGIDNLIIKNVKFNLNLKGRMGLKLTNCNHFFLQNLNFTGYSKEFGYYKTDGGLQINDCNYGIGIGLTWEDHGFQYDESTENLNRCLTIHGTSDNCMFIGLKFIRVNQAIVVNNGSHIFDNLYFEDVRDNDVYAFGAGHKVFSNIISDSRHDESFVISGGSYEIRSAEMKNVPNKFVTINGDVEGLTLKDIKMDNSGQLKQGQFIAARETTSRIGRLVIDNVEMFQKSTTDGADFIRLGIVDDLVIENLKMDVKTNEYQRLIRILGKSKGVIRASVFKGTDVSSLIEASSESEIVWEDNELNGCRASITGFVMKSPSVQFSAGPYMTGNTKNSLIYSNVIPDKGAWITGDMCLKPSPTISDNLGWICIAGGSPGTWEPIGRVGLNARSRGGAPVNWLSPKYLGEIVIDTLNNDAYIGVIVGNQSTGWKKITS